MGTPMVNFCDGFLTLREAFDLFCEGLCCTTDNTFIPTEIAERRKALALDFGAVFERGELILWVRKQDDGMTRLERTDWPETLMCKPLALHKRIIAPPRPKIDADWQRFDGLQTCVFEEDFRVWLLGNQRDYLNAEFNRGNLTLYQANDILGSIGLKPIVKPGHAEDFSLRMDGVGENSPHTSLATSTVDRLSLREPDDLRRGRTQQRLRPVRTKSAEDRKIVLAVLEEITAVGEPVDGIKLA